MTLARTVALNASAMTAGRALVAVLGIVSVGISTRYLGITEYGALAAGIAFAAVVGIVTDIGIWTIGAREIAKRPGETQQILGALLTVGFVLSSVAVLVGVLGAHLLYGGANDALTRRAALMLLVTVPLAAPYGAINAYFLAKQQAYVGTVVNVAGSIVALGLLVAASTLDWGFTGVVLAYVSAAVVQATVMGAFSIGKVRLRPSTDLALSRQMLGWALPLGGAILVHSLYWRIDIVLLSAMAADSEVALYGLAYRVVDALVVLPAFVTITMFPELARAGAGHGRFHTIVDKGFTAMLVGAAAMLVLFVTFARDVAEIAGGSGFAGAAPVLQLLMVGVALTFLAAMPSMALVSENRQKSLLVMSLGLLPLNVGLNLLLIPTLGATGAALAFSASELVHFSVLLVLYRRVGPIPRVRRAPQVIAAAILMGAVGLLNLLPFLRDASPLAVLPLGGSIAIAVYVAALYAFRAMPEEIHQNLVLPLWTRLRFRRAST